MGEQHRLTVHKFFNLFCLVPLGLRRVWCEVNINLLCKHSLHIYEHTCMPAGYKLGLDCGNNSDKVNIHCRTSQLRVSYFVFSTVPHSSSFSNAIESIKTGANLCYTRSMSTSFRENDPSCCTWHASHYLRGLRMVNGERLWNQVSIAAFSSQALGAVGFVAILRPSCLQRGQSFYFDHTWKYPDFSRNDPHPHRLCDWQQS